MNLQFEDWNVKYFWNTPYDEVQLLQKQIIEKLRLNNPKEKYLLIGSHPHCFTMGRGLQKKDGEVLDNLIEFDESETKHQFPDWNFYKSSRAGGMTFHHPGQIVIYPLMNLNTVKISLPKIMFLLLEACKSAVEETIEKDKLLEIKKEPLGLWMNGKKIASIGMALDHFVTCHGLALNLEFDHKLRDMLNQNYPCGLPGGTYAPLFAGTIGSYENHFEKISNHLVSTFIQSIDKISNI